MDFQEKTIARHLFQNKILKADGQSFEDLFTAIMNYTESDFQQIKPWGNIGDRKNDGYIKSKGIFFQVFAPEDIDKTYTNMINKLETDFAGLKENWSPINEFYFVVNDKYKGVSPDAEKLIQALKKSHNLERAGFLTAKYLENILFQLVDDQILTITGFFPDPASIKYLDYSILAEVISYIMRLPLPEDDEPEIRYPDWDEKIEFNNLSEHVAKYLNNGCIQLSSLNKYLKNNSDFLADSLRDKMNEIYIQEKKDSSGDDLFWAIVNCASPKPEQIYQISVIVIMAKYFETCDIFEEPTQGEIQ
jgi:hypothetical protein